ncbi:MAG: hypothetical protein HOV87_09000 [Catenulispora sp.]|nr:hypothetical protein [Catenulispora sp.]
MTISADVETDTEVRVAPASPAQRTLWLANRTRGGLGLLSVPVVLRLTGPLDAEALERALAAVVDCFGSLRTTVEVRNRALTQVIRPAGALGVRLERPAAAVTPFADAFDQVRELLLDEPDPKVRPVRAALWRTGPDEHLFVVNVNHLMTDGWSNRLVLSALGRAYTAIVADRRPELEPEQTRYADFAAAAAGSGNGVSQAGRRFWADVLRGARFAELPGPERELATTVFRAAGSRPPARHLDVELDPAALDRLREVARERRTTLFVLLMSAFMHGLAARTGQEDLAVGSIFANRSRPELHGTVGMFANLSVLRARITDDPVGCVDQLRRAVLGALTHQSVHHATLPYGSGAEIAAGSPQNAVFHMIAQPPGTGEDRDLFAGLESAELAWPDGLASRFELELVLAQRSGRLTGLFRYAADRLDADWVGGVRDAFSSAVAVISR